MDTMLPLESRLAGGLIGLLVGDALGVPYEFHEPEAIPPRDEIELQPPRGFARAHHGVPPGTWSDDGAQALALLDSLLVRGGFDAHDFARRLQDWYSRGRYTPDGKVFDCGAQTTHALHALARGTEPLSAGPAGEADNGNGALMRVLPLALWHTGSDTDIVDTAQLQSRLTHGHVRSQVICAFYCLWARALLAGEDGGWERAAATLAALYAGQPEHLAELEFITRPGHGRRIRGSGYVLHTLWATRHALEQDDYEAVVKAAIALGEDTDTTAAVAGGLAGIRHGLEGIPQRWRTGLRGYDIAGAKLDALLRHRRIPEPPSAQA